MDVAASVIGLLAVGTQMANVLDQFVSNCIDAPSFAQTVHFELHDFTFILSKLQPIVLGSAPLNHSRASMIDIDHLSITLTGCVCTFSDLEKEISRLKIQRKMDILGRIKLSRTETTIVQLIQRLQNHKHSLTLILTILKSESSAEATNCRQSLDKQLVERIPNMSNPKHWWTLDSIGDTNANPSPAVDDSSAITVDDANSVRTITSSRGEESYRLAFESTLFISRPYRRISNSSVISLASSQRPKGRWSLFTGGSNTSVLSLPTSMHEVSGISLAEPSKISGIPLPVSASGLYNPGWYDDNITGISPLRENTLLPLLHSAAGNGQRGLVQYLLDRGVNKEMKDKNGNTPLHSAAMKGHEEIVRLLLDRGADMEAKDNDEDVPLHKAAIHGHGAVAQLLLDRGADTGAKDNRGDSPLHKAVIHGHKAIVQLLLDRGADTGAKGNYGNTSLHKAVIYGHEAIVQLLLDRGVDTGANGNNGNTLLHDSAARDREAIAQLLIYREAGGSALLHQAVRDGCKAIVQFLLDQGEDKEVKDKNGNTLLHNAVIRDQEAVVQLLLDRGADMEAKCNYGNTPLHDAVAHGREAIAQLLLDRGADTEAKDNNWNTPLHKAAIHGHEAVVQLLLDRGADTEAKINNWSTPLHKAAIHGHKAIVQLLLDRGADKGAKDKIGETPFHHAAIHGHLAVVQLLLDRGADMGAKSEIGDTPLNKAARGGHGAIVQLMLDRGADKEMKNDSGYTAEQLAKLPAMQRL